MTELDDLTLRRAQAGDASAQRALVVLYQDRVFGFCRRVLASGDAAAEDAAQEALLAALAALGKFSPAGTAKLSSWILAISYRKCMDALRTRSATRRVLAAMPTMVPARVQTVDGALVAALAELTPEHRAVLILCDAYEFTYEEAADAIGVAIGTVRSRLSRARTAARTAYDRVLGPAAKGVAR
jgi:RNA polymerase sigma-70 factor, ECF subfamily